MMKRISKWHMSPDSDGIMQWIQLGFFILATVVVVVWYITNLHMVGASASDPMIVTNFNT